MIPIDADRPELPPPVPREAPRPLDARSFPLGRAAFLGTVAAGLGGIALASRFGGTPQQLANAVGSITPGGSALDGLLPGDGWRIYAVNPPFPRFDPARWTLKVSGLVERPLTLSWAQFAALASTPQTSTFHCVTGWTVPNVRWQGVRPQTLIDLVRPLPTAGAVRIVSAEQGYFDSLTLRQLLLPDVLLASQQDGAPLKREHGGPLRLVIPEMYGYKNVKWVSELVFEATPARGYWEQRGYDTDAWVGRSNGY